MEIPSGCRNWSRAGAQHQRQRAEHAAMVSSGWPESQQAACRSLTRRIAFVALGVERKVDHHDGFFFTIPISRIMPMIATIVSQSPAAISARARRYRRMAGRENERCG